MELHCRGKSPGPASDVEAEPEGGVGRFRNLEQLRDREVELVGVGGESLDFKRWVEAKFRV